MGDSATPLPSEEYWAETQRTLPRRKWDSFFGGGHRCPRILNVCERIASVVSVTKSALKLYRQVPPIYFVTVGFFGFFPGRVWSFWLEREICFWASAEERNDYSCVPYVFFVSPTTLSLSGLLQLCVRRWRQGHGALLWLLAQLEIEAHPLFFLFCCICNCNWRCRLFFIRQEKKAERERKSCEPAELFSIAREEEEENYFLGGGPFLVIDEWNGMAKGAAPAASFPPFFLALLFSSFTDSVVYFFFISFYLFPLLLVQREKSRVSTQTHTQSRRLRDSLATDRRRRCRNG